MASRTQKLKGSCQLCGVIAATDLQTGYLLKHEGPKSWSFMKEHGCPSSGGLPFQLSKDLVAGELEKVAASISNLKQRVDDIMNRPGNTVMRLQRDGSRLMSPFELSAENKHIWTQETGPATLEEAIKKYKIWEAYPIEQSAVELFGYEIWLKNQLASWQQNSLIAARDKDTISTLNKKRTADIRSAKQQAKDEFEYAVQLSQYYEGVSTSYEDDHWLAGEIMSQRKSAAGVAWGFPFCTDSNIERVALTLSPCSFQIPLVRGS